MEKIRIEVVYALPGAQDVTSLELEPGATVADAIAASGLPARHPQLRGGTGAVGINGKVVYPGRALEAGDRVEIYRPLAADPKDARRARARIRAGKR